MLVSLVRFRSKLADETVQAKFEERADRYRKVPGLVEKIYVRFRDTDEFGAIYVWASGEALEAFRKTELALSIPDAYRVTAPPRVELADVCLVVRPENVPSRLDGDREASGGKAAGLTDSRPASI